MDQTKLRSDLMYFLHQHGLDARCGLEGDVLANHVLDCIYALIQTRNRLTSKTWEAPENVKQSYRQIVSEPIRPDTESGTHKIRDVTIRFLNASGASYAYDGEKFTIYVK